MDIIRPESKQPLPPHAVRVFKGILFDTYQWEQELFDGSTTTFEKLKRPDTVLVIPVTENGRIIITRQEQPGKKPFVSFAGGQVGENEGILDAAIRELNEETGYQSDTWTLFDATQPISKIDWAVYTFIARNCVSTGSVSLDAGEKIDVETVSFDTFVDIITAEGFHESSMSRRAFRCLGNPVAMAEFKRNILG